MDQANYYREGQKKDQQVKDNGGQRHDEHPAEKKRTSLGPGR